MLRDLILFTIGISVYLGFIKFLDKLIKYSDEQYKGLNFIEWLIHNKDKNEKSTKK